MPRRRSWAGLRPSGTRLVIAALLVLLAGWNTGTNVFYVIFGSAMGLLAASFLLSRLNMRGLEVRVEAAGAVHRGGRLPVSVHLRKGTRSWPAVSLRVALGEGAPAYLFRADSSAGSVITLYETMDRRGVHTLPPVTVTSGFPFGFAERRRVYPSGQKVVVYPRVRAVRPVVLDRATGGGNLPQRVVGGGDEFFSLREYYPGDDPRRIAWRASARRGVLLVRELSIDTVRSVMCVLDTRMQPGVVDYVERFEEAVDLTASLAVTLIRRQYQAGVATGSGVVPLGEGPGHALAVLDALARVTPDEGGAIEHAHAALGGTPARFLGISPDPMAWGTRQGGLRVLDPREVVHV